jgi:hypothetical protein
MAIPYEHPKLIMIAPANTDANTLRIAVSGGLPQLPGSSTVFPKGAAPIPTPPEHTWTSRPRQPTYLQPSEPDDAVPTAPEIERD